MKIELQQELGIYNCSPEQKKRIFTLYEDVVKLSRQHEELLRMIKISMMNEAELAALRNELASKGYEWTPDEAKNVQKVIKIVLKYM